MCQELAGHLCLNVGVDEESHPVVGRRMGVLCIMYVCTCMVLGLPDVCECCPITLHNLSLNFFLSRACCISLRDVPLPSEVQLAESDLH